MSKLAQVQLWLDTDSAKANEFVLDLSKSFKLNEQVGRDLGEKMNFAINESLASKNSKCALLIGSDCPATSMIYSTKLCVY